ncbi:hypothetical protein G3O07_03395 [Pseudomonas laurentiana]|uniref:Uncharacterized protein n=1 Tax=Pseudomonas laurentiana TaxID=2364649 RepID=A0A6I5RM01_9PSED|nr:hypothetical protein [Pseudomonas laurentiana]
MKSLYVVYLMLALGVGAIAWNLVGAMNDANEGAVACAALEATEQDQCFKDVEKKLKSSCSCGKGAD